MENEDWKQEIRTNENEDCTCILNTYKHTPTYTHTNYFGSGKCGNKPKTTFLPDWQKCYLQCEWQKRTSKYSVYRLNNNCFAQWAMFTFTNTNTGTHWKPKYTLECDFGSESIYFLSFCFFAFIFFFFLNWTE